MGFFSSLLSDLLGQPAGGAGALGGIGGAVSGLSDAGAALIAFFTTITDYTMWRSLGWLVLGVVLIGGGVTLWAKTETLGRAL